MSHAAVLPAPVRPCCSPAGFVPSSAADDPEPPDPKTELRRWSGTFNVVHFESEGRKYDAAELKKMKVTLKDGRGDL